jgi:thymidine phosphorylase
MTEKEICSMTMSMRDSGGVLFSKNKDFAILCTLKFN